MRVQPFQIERGRGSIEDMYETFDHTADLGLRIRAGDLNTLFAEAGLALVSVMVEDPTAIQSVQAVKIELPSDELDYLLFDWLKTLLYHFDAEKQLFARFDVEVSENGLKATAWGETLDQSRHELAHEVKAITYHDLQVAQTADGWVAEVIVDI